jgi:hypothetical protein
MFEKFLSKFKKKNEINITISVNDQVIENLSNEDLANVFSFLSERMKHSEKDDAR